MTGIADAARSELLERLAHFKTTPRTVLDLSGGVTDTDAGARRRTLPAARVIATRGPVDGEIAAAPDAGVVRRTLDALRRLLPGTAPHVAHLTATPDRLPLDDGSIDLVLGHWLAPGAAALDPVLAESRRVLAPGGLFLWTTPGLGAAAEPLDMHDLGGARARAGVAEPVLGVDRPRTASGAIGEVLHAAAFAGEARGRGAGDATTAETVIPLDQLGRRRPSSTRAGDRGP
ncbi:MAG: methyltransferase domain-containing protein [Gammaproteobacteria bacterium]